MSNFDIKQNDTLPLLIANLKNSDGTAINLTSTTVLFKLININNDALIINTAATITSASLGTVEYTWTANDTSVVGEFKGEFEITFSGGEVQSVPTKGYINIRIHNDLD